MNHTRKHLSSPLAGPFQYAFLFLKTLSKNGNHDRESSSVTFLKIETRAPAVKVMRKDRIKACRCKQKIILSYNVIDLDAAFMTAL